MENTPIHAIYHEHEDGTFKFVCSFNLSEIEGTSLIAPLQSDKYVESIREDLNESGTDNYVILKFTEGSSIPRVIDASALMSKETKVSEAMHHFPKRDRHPRGREI